jgi:hypothetical protein
VFDHSVQEIPVASAGPVSDAFIGIPGPAKYGPVFDHDVAAFIGGIPQYGPIHDGFARKSIDSYGPIFDHVIDAPPPPLEVRDPNTVTVDPVRDTIEPDPVDFLSPGIYGLEKDADGNVTGFKF